MPVKTNDTLIKKAEDLFDRLGTLEAELKKDTGVITLENTNFGNLMPRQAVEELLTLSYKKNEWLASLNNVLRQARTGAVPVLTINGNVTEGIGEGEGTPVTNLPTTYNVPYICKKFRSDWYLSYDELKEAAALGLNSYEANLAALYATAIGNDKANLAVNGDETLGSLTSLNRLLRMCDGIGVLAESGNVFDGEGAAFGIGIFDAMKDAMPEEYRNDPNLRWLYNGRVQTQYHAKLAALGTALGDTSKTNIREFDPQGIKPLIVPQISPYKGPAAIAPTSATDVTTYIQFVLTTLVTAGHVASAALGVGRKFKVTCVPTGSYEVCTGILDTTLRINTSGLLGQTTVSTTNTDYLVQLYDETDLYLTNPKSVTLVDCYEMRSAREYEQNNDRWHITTYFYMDLLMPNPANIVKFKRVAVTQLESWT